MITTRPLSWSEHSYASHVARSAESREERNEWVVYVCRRAMGKTVRIPGACRPLSRGEARKLVRRAIVLHTRHFVSSVFGMLA